MIISKIIRTELQNLFFSPVAWFLAVVFLIQCAYFYMALIVPNVHVQDWEILNAPPFKGFSDLHSLTNKMLFSQDSMVAHVYQNLFLFIPLLTMGVISREINNGTIKLLYSSPINLRSIILGKYLAVMIILLLLIGILGFFMVMGAFHIKAFDYGLCLSGLLGLTLLAGAYSAIGIFMSSLTTYQIVAGIATFMTFFLLSWIGGVWQQYDFVRDLTWFLSINGRTQQMLGGMITTRDVIYFIIVIVMFLSFTLFKLKGEKESKPWITKSARYLIVIVVSLLLGYITSRPGMVGYLDATAENVNTIAPEAQEILKKMGNDPLEITLYTNLLGNNLIFGLPEARNPYLYGFWDKYLRFKSNIKFKYVYYYDNDNMRNMYPNKTQKEISGIMARQLMLDSSKFISPKEIRKQMDPYSEELNLFMTAKFKGDTVNLRTYSPNPDIWPGQREVASKFKRLIEKKGPKVYFLSGNLERSIYKTGEREYSNYTTRKDIRESLVNFAFDVDTLSLEKQDIPADATALVLADPKTELGNITLNKIKKYISAGGNIFVLGEPGKQDIVNPVLSHLGVRQMKGQLVQTSYHETPDKITPYLLKASLNIFQLDESRRKAALKDNNEDPTTLMIGAAPLTYGENGLFHISPFMKTLPDGPKAAPPKKAQSGLALTVAQKAVPPYVQRRTWLKMGHLVSDSVPPVFSQLDGDIKNPYFITALSITRKTKNKEQRAIVMGDADYLTNGRSNFNVFKHHFYNWFDYGEHPVFIPRAYHKDILFLVSEPTIKMLELLCVWVLPALLVFAGTIILIRRKRK